MLLVRAAPRSLHFFTATASSYLTGVIDLVKNIATAEYTDKLMKAGFIYSLPVKS